MPLTLQATPLSAVVKDSTQLLHRETEDLLMPHLASVQTKEDYAAILAMFYGFYSPLEKLIEAQVPSYETSALAGRRKAGSILHDLAALSLSATNLPTCNRLPQVKTSAQAFGALYVLEGSTLGGKFIANMLRKNPPLTVSDDALQFFLGYKEETGKKWTSFLHLLNEQPDATAIAAAAGETFYYLKCWMQQCFEHDKN